MNIFQEPSIYKKLGGVEASLEALLTGASFAVPDWSARDAEVCALKDLPAKPGLSKPSGQARLLHDLASIELQAMELGLRTLCEFSEAPRLFREELAEVVLDEARHLRLCLDEMEALGYQWGDWPIHLGLWQSVSADDSLIDRVLIVHRYLEGSGLDAGDSILRRLNGVPGRGVRQVVKVISDEEVGHVQFGSSWYRRLCQKAGIEAGDDFGQRLTKLFHRIPRRLERLNRPLRRKAGFSDRELDDLEFLQKRWVDGGENVHKVPFPVRSEKI